MAGIIGKTGAGHKKYRPPRDRGGDGAGIGYIDVVFEPANALTRLATGYWPAATLIAAVRLGVFDRLAEPQSAANVAESLGGAADRVEALLDALVAMTLATKSRDGRYAIAPEYVGLLSRSSPTCMLDALAYNADLYRQWANLADVILGQSPATAGRQLGADPAMTRRFVMGMEAKAKAFSPAVSGRIDLSEVSTLLDIGSGPGTLTRLLLERYPKIVATLLDLPPVLAVARDICAASPVAARLAYHPADYRLDPLPGSFDAVVYAGALHQETPASAADLFAKIHASLVRGGRLFVVDLMLDDGRTSPAFSAMFQLNMMLLRPGARVFEASDVTRMLASTGFTDIAIAEAGESPYRIVSGTAPLL